ncbi:MAG: nuclear transport factor 2 family protein [Acidobacteria bacterium]|nr:nuclear transport factor 2 family protein [Acidobacteriota bacterium]
MRRIFTTALAILLLAVAAVPQGERLKPALASLVETERAFARTSVERGARAAFAAYFSDEGIAFQPDPVKPRASLSQPTRIARPPVTLNWFPVYGDVSAAGDLGYTTGPYVFSDDTKKTPPSYGYYFTVWKRQADGAWRVALDLGIDTPPLDLSPQALTFHPARGSSWKGGRAKIDPAAARGELLAAERAFSAASRSGGAARAFASYGSDDARFNRSGSTPVVGARAIESYLRENVAKFSWGVIDAGAAQSGDFGYAYGSYELAPAAGKGGETERGYFARVWRRDARGRWRAVMSVAHATPPEKK